MPSYKYYFDVSPHTLAADATKLHLGRRRLLCSTGHELFACFAVHGTLGASAATFWDDDDEEEILLDVPCGRASMMPSTTTSPRAY
jgi:hypothetical protein